MAGIFDKFFAEDTREVEAAQAEAEEYAQIAEFCRTLYYTKLIAHLEGEALKTIPLGDTMLQSAARANAYKEVREWLLANQRRAQRYYEALAGE